MYTACGMSGDASVLSDLDDVGVAMVRLDDLGALTFLGGAWRALWGDDGENALGEPLWELAAATSRTELERSVRSVLSGEQSSVHCEFELAGSAGTSCWVELRLRAAHTPSRGIGSVGALWEIGARKRAERNVQRRKELQSHLLRWAMQLQTVETFDDLLEAVRSEVRVRVGYEDAWLFMLAGEGDEQHGELIAHSGLHRKELARAVQTIPIKGDAMLEQLLRAEGPVVVDDARTDPRTNKELVATLGSRTIINVPLLLVDKLLGSFGTGTYADIGPRPPSEEELEYLVSMASHIAVAVARVRFLDQQRENRRLRERVLRSERFESLGVLAGAVAHDFNNMLAVVLANAQLAHRRLPIDSPVRPYVADVQTAATRAAKLSDQIRAFSGKADTRPAPVDLCEIVAETVELVSGASSHGPAIMFERPARPLVMIGDRAQLQQVVMNLLTNAVEATCVDGDVITVALSAQELASDTEQLTQGNYVRLSVSDTGPGIPERIASHVFDPFFTTKRNARGLGMAVVQGLVKIHKGQVDFTSFAGRGTEFTVLFPRADEEVLSAAAATEQVASEITGTILVVDDEDRILDSTTAVLEDYGCRVVTAGDGAEAIDIVRAGQHDISVVLLDLRMPVLDGREVFSLLRNTHEALPVLFASGYPVDDVQSLVGTDPHVGFVQKPYDFEVLVQRLRGLAGATRAAR